MFTRLAQLTLVALALTIGNHATAAPLVYGTYYDDTVSGVTCNSANSNFCRLNFAQLPADKLLLIQKVSCTMGSSQPLTQTFLNISATLGGGSATSRLLPIALPPPQFIGSIYFTSFREDTRWLIGNGRFPYLLAFGPIGTVWPNMTCTLMGELVTPL